MTEHFVWSTIDTPSEVYGVHGAEGLTYWKCLARRDGLAGPWEAVEWASVPPGGVSGEHLHTRTEEVYFILSGRGRSSSTANRAPCPLATSCSPAWDRVTGCTTPGTATSTGS
ncbi:hypothetical protein [Carbonactinospora thermoautotrophica]|uniref:hypothetical protein n=1 Tax=Carbonactinospora thermoautotrophica TaxID=1469144 RepID=UPI000B1E277A|nr:hypothetical protein [Carbonactinospora thermoautotrophica]